MITVYLKDINLNYDDKYRYIKGTNILFSKTNYKNVNLIKIEKDLYIKSLGIDIEPIDRKMSKKLSKAICTKFDFEKDPLKSWVIKEAVFKAVYSLNQKVNFFDIKIDSFNKASFKDLKIKYSIKIIKISNSHYYLAEAII